MRDLTSESDEAIAAERTKVATQGWEATILRFKVFTRLKGGESGKQYHKSFREENVG